MKPYEESGKVITIEEMVRPDRPVTYGIVKAGTNVDGGVPVVRVKDFTDGSVHTDDLLHTKPELNAKYLRSTLLEGDILLSIGGTIGRVAIVPKEIVGANITQHTARISLRAEYDTIYVKGVLESPIMQDVMARNKLGVAQVGLNLRDIRKFPVPDVPKEMQKRLSAIYEQSDKSKHVALRATLSKLVSCTTPCKKGNNNTILRQRNTLRSDIWEGLNAETSVQQKQSEYYLDKLLPFKNGQVKDTMIF